MTKGTAQPDATDLTSADGNNTIAAAAHVVVTFEPVGTGGDVDRARLQVTLRNLRASNPPRGVYEGYAYLDQTILAQIVAVIV